MCGQYWKKWEEPSGYFFHKYYLYNYKRVWIVFLISNKETAALSNRSCRSIIRWANSTPWTVTDRHFDVQRSKQPVTGCQLHGGYVYAWCVSRALIEGCTIMASRKRFKTDNKELWPTFGRTADPHLLCPVDWLRLHVQLQALHHARCRKINDEWIIPSWIHKFFRDQFPFTNS